MDHTDLRRLKDGHVGGQVRQIFMGSILNKSLV
jgi:hypothetical protein